MRFENKTILLISPQSWGQMLLSKHHYAIELAKMNNRVYFLSPPQNGAQLKKGEISVTTSCEHFNLIFIEHRLKFPFLLKFHFSSLFHWLMHFHIQQVLKKIGEPIDIVWSFDQGNLYPFNFFSTESFKIFQPVDEPQHKTAIEAATGSDIILSVTGEILEKYKAFLQPRYLVNHGISEHFLSKKDQRGAQKAIHVGFSGNMLRQDIDRDTLLEIIRQNPEIIFECWGSYTPEHSNVGGNYDEATRVFIQSLKKWGVLLHGPISSKNLAIELNRMDAFLICYDVKKDQSKGTNYHKVMEYLSTGKTVIANNISTYNDRPELVSMVKERDNNSSLPSLFLKMIENIEYYNSDEFSIARKEFAKQNTYLKQIHRIQKIVHEEFGNSKTNRIKPYLNVHKGSKELHQG